MLDANGPVGTNTVEPAPVELRARTVVKTDAAHPTLTLRAMPGKRHAQRLLVIDGRRTTAQRRTCRSGREQVHVVIVESRQQRIAARIDDAVTAAWRQLPFERDDPLTGNAQVEQSPPRQLDPAEQQ